MVVCENLNYLKSIARYIARHTYATTNVSDPEARSAKVDISGTCCTQTDTDGFARRARLDSVSGVRAITVGVCAIIRATLAVVGVCLVIKRDNDRSVRISASRSPSIVDLIKGCEVRRRIFPPWSHARHMQPHPLWDLHE